MKTLNQEDIAKLKLLIKALTLKLSSGSWCINDEYIEPDTITLLQLIVDNQIRYEQNQNS